MSWAGAVREASGGEELELDKWTREAIPGPGHGRSTGRKQDFSGPLRGTLRRPGGRYMYNTGGFTLCTSENREALLLVNL